MTDQVDKISQQMEEAAALGLFAVTQDRNLGALIERAKGEFDRRRDKALAMANEPGRDFKIAIEGDDEIIAIDANTRDHALVRMGIMLALETMGDFPIRMFAPTEGDGHGE